MEKKAWIGLTAIIPTIIIGKIDIEFPAIHIINRFIGSCLMGANATSHDLYAKQAEMRTQLLIS